MAFGSQEFLQAMFPLPVSHPIANNRVGDPSWQIEMVDQILFSWRKSTLPTVSYSKETLRNTVEKKMLRRKKKNVERENGKSYRKLYEQG